MEEQEKKKGTTDSFVDIFESFGAAIGKVFDDPELKEKAKELGKSAAESANTLANRFKDEEVQEKFREVGKAAEQFGKNVADYFKEKKEK